MKKRIQIVFIIFCFIYSAVILKAFTIQILNKEPLLAYARNQYLKTTKERLSRGNIFDRNGQPLAINIHNYNLGVSARNKNEKFYKQLKTITQIIPQLKYQKLFQKIKNRTKFTTLATEINLTEFQLKEIKKLDRMSVEKNTMRYYPNNELLSNVIGFVGRDKLGLSGIEQSLEKELNGGFQTMTFVRDAKGRPIRYEKNKSVTPAKDIVLSIDKDIQAALETYLKETITHHQAIRAGAAVMDARTGEIIALANFPNFDLNKPFQATTDNKKLSFVSDPFEPGSILKTFTIASALENKIATQNKKYNCEKGRFRVQNHYITEAEQDKKFEWLTMKEILSHSSNIGTTKIAFDLKYPALKKTFVNFGLTEKTGIEMKGESKGISPKGEKIKPLTLSNMSFGHGIATTPIQMLRAYSAIANGGILIKPTLIKTDRSQLSEGKRVISKKITQELTDMLVDAVENGTGTNAIVPHYVIAGKTGTAQRVSPQGGYQGYISSFVGFPVNVENPFVVLVYVDNPKTNGYYGNVVAAPVFKKISQYLLYKKKDFTRIAQYNETPNNLDHVTVTNSISKIYTPGIVPNFIGMDKMAVTRFVENLGIKIQMRGFGVVIEQFPNPGTAITNQVINLRFTPPIQDE